MIQLSRSIPFFHHDSCSWTELTWTTGTSMREDSSAFFADCLPRQELPLLALKLSAVVQQLNQGR